MTCKNCLSELNSNFCPSCGQNSNVHRITVGHVIHEGFHSVTHADKGFLLLVRKLLTKPGIIAKEYINGRRKAFFNPLTFLVITSALFYYFDGLTGYMDAIGRSGGQGGNSRPSDEWMEVFRIAKTSGKWLTLLFIAPLSAALSWLFFIKNKYNYAEHFILHALIFGEAALFRLVFMIPLYLMFPAKIGLLQFYLFEIPFVAYMALAYYQFFQPSQELLSQKQVILRAIVVTVKAILIRPLFIALFWALIYAFVVMKNLLF